MKDFMPLSPVSNPDAFSFPYGMLSCCYDTLFKSQLESTERDIEYRKASLTGTKTSRKMVPKQIDF